MPVEIIAGPQALRGAGYRSKETLAQSTATAFQDANLYVDRIHLGMGTATGFTRNLYRLASGAVEGQIVSFLSTATGEAKVFLAGGTATGLHVFTEPDDYLLTRFEDGKWRVIISSATLATAT
jgi:hypothetical protein